MILKFVIQRKSSAEMGERHGKKFSGRAARNAFCKSIYYVGADYGNAFVYVRIPDAQDRDGRKDAGDRFGSGGCPRGICGGTLSGKKVWQTKISMGINFWHHLFSGLPGDLISYQRYEPYHTGSGEILCNNGGGGHDWGDGKLAFVR